MVHEKEQMAGLMRKFRVVVYAVVFAVVLLDTKGAQQPRESKISDGPMEQKKRNRTNKGSIGTRQMMKIAIFTPGRGCKNGIFDARCCGSIFKNVFPVEGGQHFFEKKMDKCCIW